MEDLIKSLIKRWVTKTPALAKYIQYIAIGLTIIAGLPAFIEPVLDQFDLQFVEGIRKVSDSSVGIITLIVSVLLQFTKESKK